MVDNQHSDPVLRLSNLLMLRGHYVPSPALYTHPEVSPLFADFIGFPPLLLQAGSSELLRDEAVRVAHKAHAAGVDVEVDLARNPACVPGHAIPAQVGAGDRAHRGFRQPAHRLAGLTRTLAS
jgi:acetyl esterase/lipase